MSHLRGTRVGFALVMAILSWLAVTTPGTAQQSVVVGPGGGTVTATDGTQLILAPDTFSGDETVSLQLVSQSTLETYLNFSLASEQLNFLVALTISTGGAQYA